jgi:hypothetical protein
MVTTLDNHSRGDTVLQRTYKLHVQKWAVVVGAAAIKPISHHALPCVTVTANAGGHDNMLVLTTTQLRMADLPSGFAVSSSV